MKNKTIETKLGKAEIKQISETKYLLIFSTPVTADNFKAKHRHIVNKKRLDSILIKKQES